MRADNSRQRWLSPPSASFRVAGRPAGPHRVRCIALPCSGQVQDLYPCSLHLSGGAVSLLAMQWSLQEGILGASDTDHFDLHRNATRKTHLRASWEQCFQRRSAAQDAIGMNRGLVPGSWCPRLEARVVRRPVSRRSAEPGTRCDSLCPTPPATSTLF